MDNSDFSGNAFSQRQTLYTRWITICLFKYLIPQSSISEVEHSVLSFIRLICLSISETCSCAAVVLTSIIPNLYLTFLNYIYIRTRRVTKPSLAYNFMIFVRNLVNCPDVQVGTYSQGINMIFHDKVTRNGIPLTNMISNVKVINLCS